MQPRAVVTASRLIEQGDYRVEGGDRVGRGRELRSKR